MEKERINNNGERAVDYLCDRPHRRMLETTLMRKFPGSEVTEILNFLEEAKFSVVKKIPIVPARTY